MTTDIRALLADDGYAASFQSMGQYRTALLAALRAQADAAPVAWIRFCSDGGIEGPLLDSSKNMCDVRRKSGAWTPLYPRPSLPAAQGLSDEQAEELVRRVETSVGMNREAWDCIDAKEIVRAILTSAATVAEPSAGGMPDIYPARLLNESDASLAERVDSWHKRNPQAAQQQQAEPPHCYAFKTCSSPAICAKAGHCANTFDGSQRAEPTPTAGTYAKPDADFLNAAIDAEQAEPVGDERAALSDGVLRKIHARAQVTSFEHFADDMHAILASSEPSNTVLANLVNAVRWWGLQEDGIPAEVAPAFNAAHLALGWSLSHPMDFQAAKQTETTASHEWNAEGERCLKCGDKDWFASSTCSGQATQSGQRAGVAEGWKLVPEEITPEMLQAWWDSPCHTNENVDVIAGWKAMLAAAPTQQQERGE